MILVFFTGAESVPLLGFKDPFILRFLHGEDQKLATASTCDLILRIPTCHKNMRGLKNTSYSLYKKLRTFIAHKLSSPYHKL